MAGKGGVRQYFEIKCNGRMSRDAYWRMWQGARGMGILPFLGLVGSGVTALIGSNSPPKPVVMACAMAIGGLSLFVAFWLGLAGTSRAIRRLHDYNRTGWVLLTPLPCLALPIGVAAAGYDQVALACMMLPLAAVVLNFNSLLKPGNPGDNRYGPPPAA